MSVLDSQLYEKLRPTSLDKLILVPRIRNYFNSKGLTQNVLLYGSPGTGKSTLANIVAKGYPNLYINASLDRSIDVVRNEITEFCTSASILDGEYATKVVFLDEMEGATDQFYKAMRGVIEQYKDVRFIGTTNYISKISDAIQSRFNMINFDPIDSDEEAFLFDMQYNKLHNVLSKLEIDISKEALTDFIKRNFPDMRTMYNKIQHWYNSGMKSITLNDIQKANFVFTDLYELIINNSDPIKNYQIIMSDYRDKHEEVLSSLGDDFAQYIFENYKTIIGKIPEIIISVAKHQSQRNLVIDQSVNMLSCIYDIQLILSK